MKRIHRNFTNEIKTFRTWSLMVDSMDESDFKWLHGFEIPVRIERPEHKVDVMGGGQQIFYGKPSFTCDTHTDKQRNMLVLKYGNLAVLIQEEVVLPNSQSVCVLDKVVW